MSNGLNQKLSIGIFSLLVISLVALIWVISWPFQPIEYRPTTMSTDRVRVGEVVEVTAHFVKHTNKVGTMTRYLVSVNNQETIITLGTSLASANRSDTSKTVQIEIPDYVHPGKYKIWWIVGYDYFGLRTVYVRGETPEFTVEK
jgi:hypothetical protein